MHPLGQIGTIKCSVFQDLVLTKIFYSRKVHLKLWNLKNEIVVIIHDLHLSGVVQKLVYSRNTVWDY